MRNIRKNKFKLNIKKIIILIISVILLSLLFLIFSCNKTSSHVEKNLKTIFVSNGETLWEIARIEAINNEYYSKQDIRYIIKEIKLINKLESSDLYPGQELLIPSL